jgi:solute carrier family 24 (sodium/potassium/calcium exchanger), member 6
MNKHLAYFDHQGSVSNPSRSCTHHTFFDPINEGYQCSIAKLYCDDLFDFVNFFELAYCYAFGNMMVINLNKF